LRANNATTRLTSIARDLGCVGEERLGWHDAREREREEWREALDLVVPATALSDAGLPVKRDAGRKTLGEWLALPALGFEALSSWLPDSLELAGDLAEELLEDAAYAPYLARQDEELRDLRSSSAVRLGDRFPYASVPGLSNEMVERLSASRPASLADAGRVRGITPAALAALLVHARRRDQAA